MLSHIIKFVRDGLNKITKPAKKKPEAEKKTEQGNRKQQPQRAAAPSASVNPGKKPQGQQQNRKPYDQTRKDRPARDASQQGPGKSNKGPQRNQPRRKPDSEPKVRTGAPETEVPVIEQEPWDINKFKVPQEEGKTRFHDLNLPKEIMHAIYDLGFKYTTPIQAEILFHTLTGKDATGRAQTGTGKTAAFLISIMSKLLREPIQGKRRSGTPRALIVAPTRELVIQITEDAKKLSKYTGLKIIPIYGGMDYQKQKKLLYGQAADILVATPGRLLDFYSRRDLHLSEVEVLVLDEADRMLDMGFIPDVRKIVRATPPKEKRQTLFFSATLSEDVKRLSSYWTKDAVFVEIEPEQVEVESVKQLVYIMTSDEKLPLLLNLIATEKLERVMIFANRRDEVRDLYDLLQLNGISCSILSGDVDQKQRLRTLEDFKSGKIRVLCATDVAGRGIHIEGVSHVVNYTLPQDPEDYVHRIGRTGRAGAKGISISFASEDDSFYIPAIEKYLGHPLECTYPDEDMLKFPEGFRRK